MSGALSGLYGGRGVTLVSGRGSRVLDDQSREYVDFFNGHGAVLFGHAVPELVSELAAASEGLWSCGAGFESPARAELARALGDVLGDGRVFICNSGAEAIEAALKLAVALRPGRSRILACRRGFHGRTCGALSLSFNPKYRAPFKSILTAVEHFNPDEIPGRIDEDTVAVFIEPVQGEGGVHPVSEATGRAVSDACAASGALLVADEIQSGMGRCGAMLASELTGLRPDVVCLAKGLAGGLPIGAAVWRGELGDFPSHGHGSTYGGNDLVCRVAVAALKLLRERNYAARAAELGHELRAGLRALGRASVKDVRGMGLLNGVELDIPSLGVVKALQRRGLLSLAAGPRVVRFLPSFAANSNDVSDAIRIFGETLDELEHDGGASDEPA
ncbi:MAG: aminotransferase class III-fold pyridoxal phosphate-dependent enzyme [Synergistaceae bacterium]|jgi:acetylornithine/LysW-gamma-L-lysine aminotransferase|nr:aminotransferase class III-fold pyridoxal phosphate-dependent enzyme [Synergistaceae bacterium]